VALTGTSAALFNATLNKTTGIVTIVPALSLDREAYSASTTPVFTFGLSVKLPGWLAAGAADLVGQPAGGGRYAAALPRLQLGRDGAGDGYRRRDRHDPGQRRGYHRVAADLQRGMAGFRPGSSWWAAR
jgi:hypothetical protein